TAAVAAARARCGPPPGFAVEVEPRCVQRHAGSGRPPRVGPEGHDQPAGRVPAEDDLPVPTADPLPGAIELGEVVVQSGDVVRVLVGRDRAAVLPQVEGVEVVAAPGPPLGVRRLEEVVGEAVHVQHRLRRPLAGAATDEGRDDPALVVVGQVEGLRRVRRAQHVGPGARPARILTAAAETSASNRRWSRPPSGCHWTPTQNWSPSRSIASSVPSAAQALAVKPGCSRTDWWWWHCTRVSSPTAVLTRVPGSVRTVTAPYSGPPGLCSSWPTTSGECCSSAPPAATAISCMPRHTPSVGSPCSSAASISAVSQASRSSRHWAVRG